MLFIRNRTWFFWLIVVLFIIFVIWLVAGGKDHEYTGLKPLLPEYDASRYVDSDTLDRLNNHMRPKDVCMMPSPDKKPDSPPHEQVNPPRAKLIINPRSPRINVPTTFTQTVFNQAVSDDKTRLNGRYGGKKRKTQDDSRGEAICRRVLEEIYGKPFPKARPGFLKNPESGHNLELDGYNEELGIAFEYNGIQHYVFPNWIHRREEEYIAQVRRDKYKIDSCDQSGVYLITVPYKVPHNMIRDFIIYYLPENVQARMDAMSRGETIQTKAPGL